MTTSKAHHLGIEWEYMVHSRNLETSRDDNEIIIGIDTEYAIKPPIKMVVNGEEAFVEDTENKILSYQFYAIANEGIAWSGIHILRNGKRIKFSTFISSVIAVGLSAGLIRHRPKSVSLCGHFSIADITAFEDTPELVRSLDAARKTFVSLAAPIQTTIYDNNRHKYCVEVHVRDSMLLAPSGASALKALGDLIGLEKIDLEPGQIEKMDELLTANPKLFIRYAIRDAEIAALYCYRMRELNMQLLGKCQIPYTLSSIGINLLFKKWTELGIDSNEVLGFEMQPDLRYIGFALVNCEKKVKKAKLGLYEAIAIECYHGGRNEQYVFGPSSVGVWTDYDLCGAYTTAMALLGMADWDKANPSRNISEYGPTTLGFARVKFEFPLHTRFPCLPVRTEAGLVFPIKGRAYCGAPEIYLAIEMGAKLEILDGVIVPQSTEVRPFASFIKFATEQRRLHPKKSLMEQFWKELSNASYGKTAQGLRPKNGYAPRRDVHEQLPPSRITNAFLASFVTSFVRAVLGEILAAIPSHAVVSNATTDGLLTTATEAEMDLCTSGTLCEIFKDARAGIVGTRECVEVKHRIAQVCGMRTRGQLTLLPIEGEEIVLAKAGIKPPAGDKQSQNDFMVKLFAERTASTKCDVKMFRSMAAICRKGGDLTKVTMERAVRLDPDWKRCPFNPKMVPLLNIEHLYFETKPWATAEDVLRCREEWKHFTKATDRVLKSTDDLKAFVDYRCQEAIPKFVRKSKQHGTKKVAARMFLRAFVRSMAGLASAEFNYSEVAAIITGFGVVTSREDVENAARQKSKLVPNSIPRTPSVIELYNHILQRFPAFDQDYLLMPPINNTAHPSVQSSISLSVH